MKNLRIVLTYIARMHFVLLLFFLFNRFAHICFSWEYFQAPQSDLYKIKWVLIVLLRGIVYDNILATFVGIIPLVLLLITYLSRASHKIYKVIYRLAAVYYAAAYILLSAINIADIPYFKYFFNHINTSIFNWIEDRGVAQQMVLQESSYYIYFFIFLLLVVLFIFVLYVVKLRMRKEENIEKSRKNNIAIIIITSILISGLYYGGVRFYTKPNPIGEELARVALAINILSDNPALVFMQEILSSDKDDANLSFKEEPVLFVRKQLGLDQPYAKGESPIMRNIKAQGKADSMNVVIVMMESVGAKVLTAESDGKKVMPYLNKLIEKSYYFPNIFTQGIHTYNGVLSTIYGLPSIINQHIMRQGGMVDNGLPNILHDYGYDNAFFVSHNKYFDNMGDFLTKNGYNNVYSEENYPQSKIVNTLGVDDAYLFDYALAKINEKATSQKYFFATILTISNHPPYTTPEKYKAISDYPPNQTANFTDDVIRQFMQEAAKQEWYKNTLFVFVGDHGRIDDAQKYQMPLDLNHVSLIIYSPTLKDAPKVLEQYGTQCDIPATILGILNYSYTNNTLGVDLLKEKQKYAYLYSDDSMGCIDPHFFYSYNLRTKKSFLYKLDENNSTNYIDHYKVKADSMLQYTTAMQKVSSVIQLKNIGK